MSPQHGQWPEAAGLRQATDSPQGLSVSGLSPKAGDVPRGGTARSAREQPSPPHGRPKAGDVPRGGTARSAREQPSPPHGRPKAGDVPRGGTARSAREQP